MGKLLETLRRLETLTNGQGGPSGKDQSASLDDAALMPYIEVGPKRSMEGSPDVMGGKVEQVGVVTFRGMPSEGQPRVAPELVAYHAPGGAASLRYSELLSQVLDSLRCSGTSGQVLLFTSLKPGAGTTTVVLNLAITAARQGRQVLVVEGNSERMAVGERLGLSRGPGLAEVLAGYCTLQQALRETAQTKLQVLAGGGWPGVMPASVEALRSALRQLRQQFDLVVVDSQPWSDGVAQTCLGPVCDAVFLVVRRSEAEAAEVAHLTRQLPGQGIPLLGSIVSGL